MSIPSGEPLGKYLGQGGDSNFPRYFPQVNLPQCIFSYGCLVYQLLVLSWNHLYKASLSFIINHYLLLMIPYLLSGETTPLGTPKSPHHLLYQCGISPILVTRSEVNITIHCIIFFFSNIKLLNHLYPIFHGCCLGDYLNNHIYDVEEVIKYNLFPFFSGPTII